MGGTLMDWYPAWTKRDRGKGQINDIISYVLLSNSHRYKQVLQLHAPAATDESCSPYSAFSTMENCFPINWEPLLLMLLKPDVLA